MSLALASATISDHDAIAAAKSLDMPAAQRLGLWQQRWQRSEALRSEFGTADLYSAFMEASVTGRCKVSGISPPSAQSSARQIQDASDARFRALARSAGWSRDVRMAQWASLYSDCADINSGFVSAENYASYMEGEFALGR